MTEHELPNCSIESFPSKDCRERKSGERERERIGIVTCVWEFSKLISWMLVLKYYVIIQNNKEKEMTYCNVF